MQIETQQKWSAIIAKQQVSRLTVVEFCQQAQIAISTFYQRRCELVKVIEPTISFVKADVVTESATIKKATSEAIHLTAGSIKLSLPSHTRADYLTQLIKG